MIIPPFCKLKHNKNKRFWKGDLPPGAVNGFTGSRRIGYGGMREPSKSISSEEAKMQVQMWLWQRASLHKDEVIISHRYGYWAYEHE